MTSPSDLPFEGGPFHPLKGDRFQFNCHPGVPCFNECCAQLNLLLTPYDILRLKKRLGLDSSTFLEQHTEMISDDHQRFPKVQLKMTDREGRPCPFVAAAGCTIYEDRPGACRTYPLGRGSAKGGREMFFLVREDHCRGFEEDKTWEVKEWLADQGLEEYNRVNDRWMEIITEKASLGPPENAMKKIQMFFMVSYNLDRFRDFVYKSRFLHMFELDSKTVEQAREDDLALLYLGYDWLDFALFGKKTMTPKG